MKNIVNSFVKQLHSAKVVAGFVIVTAVALVSVSNVSAAAPAYFNVDKSSPQSVCYTQYGGEGWKALGFSNLDHCLRYVSTAAPDAKEDCNQGYWYVWGFNSWNQCADWVIANGGSGYAGNPDDQY